MDSFNSDQQISCLFCYFTTGKVTFPPVDIPFSPGICFEPRVTVIQSTGEKEQKADVP